MRKALPFAGVVTEAFKTLTKAGHPPACVMTGFAVKPNGNLETIGDCQIIAPVPFTFSKEDYDIYEQMRNAELFGMQFMDAEIAGASDKATKELIAESVKSFREQRALLCGRHPDWFVFNLYTIPNGPEFSEKTPEACKAGQLP
jgi:beta-glucosidase/6-phospho-beta-glucosidase/beta-galactosidase